MEEEDAQVRAGKGIVLEREKWQAKGKALPAEMATTGTQTNHLPAEKKAQVEEWAQAETARVVEGKDRESKGTKVEEEEDVVMMGQVTADTRWQLWEALSEYEDGGRGSGSGPPATKEQAAQRLAVVEPAGKSKSQPAKTSICWTQLSCL